jgi:hypothetical protein
MVLPLAKRRTTAGTNHEQTDTTDKSVDRPLAPWGPMDAPGFCSLVCAVLLDHFGWVGFEVHRVNPWRIAGCTLLLGGLFLVSKF